MDYWRHEEKSQHSEAPRPVPIRCEFPWFNLVDFVLSCLLFLRRSSCRFLVQIFLSGKMIPMDKALA